uniref:Uncharacterized protein n=1 Tax=Arion vulgaris TaxID=1028688 RepID=A0A0B6ZZP0_9EUPU
MEHFDTMYENTISRKAAMGITCEYLVPTMSGREFPSTKLSNEMSHRQWPSQRQKHKNISKQLVD